VPRRNAVLRLNRDDQAEIEGWLRDHGFGQLRELSAKLRERGIKVSKDALMRFGKHLRAEGAQQVIGPRWLREVLREELRAALREFLPERNRAHDDARIALAHAAITRASKGRDKRRK